LELLSRESFTSSTDDPSIYVRTNYVPFLDKQRAITVHVCTTHCEKQKTFRDFGIKEKTNKQFESDDYSSGVFWQREYEQERNPHQKERNRRDGAKVGKKRLIKEREDRQTLGTRVDAKRDWTGSGGIRGPDSR
jgi:hypothetical protein